MTPINVKNAAEAQKYKQNLEGQGKPKKKREAPRRVTIHIAPDVKPETVAALAALALRVMEMPEEELREFIKRVRTK
jgi:hypothetical protein